MTSPSLPEDWEMVGFFCKKHTPWIKGWWIDSSKLGYPCHYCEELAINCYVPTPNGDLDYSWRLLNQRMLEKLARGERVGWAEHGQLTLAKIEAGVPVGFPYENRKDGKRWNGHQFA